MSKSRVGRATLLSVALLAIAMTTISTGVRGSDQQFLQNFRRNNDRTQTSLERLSTGKRINHPSDDPAGFVAAEELRGDLQSLQIKLKGISGDRQQSHLRQSGLAEIQTALNDLRGRVVSAADGSITADDRAALEGQIDEAAAAIDRIGHLTGNGTTLLIDSGADASDIADQIDGQSTGVALQQAALGAYEHTHLDTFEQLYQDQIVITTQTLSQIEDTDFAAETSNLVQSQTLSTSAMAALTYANRQRIDQIAFLLDKMA